MNKTAKKSNPKASVKVEIPANSAIVLIQPPGEAMMQTAQDYAQYITSQLERRQSVVIILPPGEDWNFQLLGTF